MIEEEGDGVCGLIHFHLIEWTHLAGYKVKDDDTDCCRICFAAHEYPIGTINIISGDRSGKSVIIACFAGYANGSPISRNKIGLRQSIN